MHMHWNPLRKLGDVKRICLPNYQLHSIDILAEPPPQKELKAQKRRTENANEANGYTTTFDVSLYCSRGYCI